MAAAEVFCLYLNDIPRMKDYRQKNAHPGTLKVQKGDTIRIKKFNGSGGFSMICPNTAYSPHPHD